MKQWLFLACSWLTFCLSSPLYAKHTQSLNPLVGNRALSSYLQQLIQSGHYQADIGIYVKSMQSGETLYTRNVYQSLMPASILKVLTAYAALLYLGPDYRFSTQLLTDAKGVKNGILQGNLYIVLSGDPSLTYSAITNLLASLKTEHIHAIAGNVYIDNTAYDQRFYGPGWASDDQNYCYAAPISASIINRNCLALKISPAKIVGQPAKILTSSRHFYPAIKNSVITKRTRACSPRVKLSPENMGPNSIALDGCMPPKRLPVGVSYVVTDIPEYNRSLFKTELNRQNIKVLGTVTFGSAPHSLSLVEEHHSAPLSTLIHEMLKKSENVIAGAIFKKLGQLYTRQPGSWENGSLAVSQILANKIGINIRGLRAIDGSGISVNNLVTPEQMMQVLNHAYHQQNLRNHFIYSLPIAGIDGTLKHRMGNITRKIRAKTGTISGVVSLAGYALSAEKEPLAFVIIINGNKGMNWRYRELEDKIATALTRYRR